MATERKTRASTGGVIVRETSAGQTFAIRYRAGGKRWYVTLGTADEGWTFDRADDELQATLRDVRRGVWSAPAPAPVIEERRPETTLQQFADEWFDRNRLGVDERTAEHWTWALSHVLGVLADLPLSKVTVEQVDGYRSAKLRERERLEAALAEWRAADPEERGERPPRPLGNGSINRTLRVLARVLDDAIEYGYVQRNPARGRNRRLKAGKPKRIWLELDEVRSLLDAAGNHKPLIATMILAGLRVGELCDLRWRAVNLAKATLTVEQSKTDAGVREVDVSPMLLDILKSHKQANDARAGADEFVFPTATGRRRDRHNVRSRLLLPALDRANTARAEAGLRPIAHVTNHTLRRTFATLLYEAGATPAYVMAQMGHESAALALEVYNRLMERKRDTGERMDALLRGDRALAGTGASDADVAFADLATEETLNPLN